MKIKELIVLKKEKRKEDENKRINSFKKGKKERR